MSNGVGSASSLKISINLSERDIIKLVVEFLHSRDLHISQLDLERETGVINSQHSDDVLFLRQLVLDGQWDDVLEFIAPLKQMSTFDAKQFTYIVMKHQYLELLCLKAEASGGSGSDNQLSVEQLVAYLSELRQYTPTEDDYKKLCLLVTSPRLQDHQEYRNWNPASGRLQCFKEILPFVAKFLEPSKDPNTVTNKPQQIAQNERLVQLLVKGLLYESCVEYCQARATNSPETYNISDPGVLLSQQQLSETDASLLSWLHALPIDTFSCPFEEKPLKLALDKFQKPSLEAQWADAILATPIKPQQLFPYNAVPSGRSRNTELMSRSLAPQYDGLGFGLLGRSQLFASGIEMKLGGGGAPTLNGHHSAHNGTNGKLNGVSHNHGSSSQRQAINDLTHSIALFNFETTNTSSSTDPSPPPAHASAQTQPPQPPPPLQHSQKTPQQPPTPAPQSTVFSPPTNDDDQDNLLLTASMTSSTSTMHDSQLFKEYKRNKAQIIQQLEEQDRKRDEFIKQLKAPNVYNAALNAVQHSTNKGVQQQQQQQIQQQQQMKVKQQMYDVGIGATGTILEEEEEEEEEDEDDQEEEEEEEGGYLSPNMRLPNGGGKQPKQQFDASSLSPPIESTAPPSAPPNQLSPSQTGVQQRQTQKQPNNNNHSPQQQPLVAVKQRPINETTKFDSLEDITKAASFQAICMIEDQQAIRAVDIHPSGDYYVVGSNSKCLRVCPYPNLTNIKSDYVCKPASVLYKKSKHHYGSIYCVAWNPHGNLIATGSNDKTIKLVKFSPDLTEDTESESELTCHNGTVRDLIFMHDEHETSSVLVSGGAGDCKVHVTDCNTLQSLRTFAGHTQHIYTLYTWPGTKNVFVSGSGDKTCRFWDLRTPESIQVVRPTTDLAMQGSPVASVAVDPSGLLLASGHEDAACCLYDIRGSRIVQCYKPHQSDVRSVRFSANAYYLLTASYDNKVIITDLHGDLTKPLNWSVVAGHNDKIIQAKWHPTQMSFVTTSADRTSTVWSLPSAALANASVV